METKFTSGEAIKFGWEKMKKHFWFLAGLLVIICLAQAIPTSIADIFKNKIVVLYVMFIVMAWILQIIVKMGATKITLDIADKDEAEMSTLFSCINLFWKFVLGSILYGLIVLSGFILLIIPGIIWAIKYQFVPYLIIDKNLGPVEAIKKSGEITMGSKGKLFWFGILLILINIAGAIAFLVGLFATIPTTMLAYVYVYRKLMGELNVSQPAVTPLPVVTEPQA